MLRTEEIGPVRSKGDVMTNAQLDSLAKFAAEWVKAGGELEIKSPPCPRCGSEERYKSNPSPNWMNRWTCPDCGRHESR
jgi:transposase-like protein